MRKFGFLLVMVSLFISCKEPDPLTYSFDELGIQPDTEENASAAVTSLINRLQSREDTTHLTITFPEGRYDFHEDSAFIKEYYISNHDQDNPKSVAFALEDLQNITIDGQGSEFIFHGRMIPFSIIRGKNITLKNLSIDFDVPAIRQLRIKEIDKEKNEVLAEIHPEGHYHIDNGKLIFDGENYEIEPTNAMAFRPDKRLAYKRADIIFDPDSVIEQSPNLLRIKGWNQTEATSPDERFALRSYKRPTPGIFIDESKNTKLKNVTIHYAEGMGVLAQMSENIILDSLSVALKGEDDPRYFTTQADATHFSAVKGKIISKNGLYEGMADDAINVHGTYLRISKRVNDSTLQAKYMHPQAWGFKWGEIGDTVQFIESDKMQLVSHEKYRIQSIKAVDKDTIFGAKVFEISFDAKLPEKINEPGKYAVENLTWTPEVIFSNNIIRNNRARGTLFSTPKRVLIENNVFDHTHGAAILLAGDANGWFETGMSRDVTIRKNEFINALTANYQFTNAIISIYPEIPNLEEQEEFFHSGILIEENTFETFDKPLVYGKSINGLTFKNNTIKHNSEFEPFHWNKHPFFFEKVKNIVIENNDFDEGFDEEKDLKVKLSKDNAVEVNQ